MEYGAIRVDLRPQKPRNGTKMPSAVPEPWILRGAIMKLREMCVCTTVDSGSGCRVGKV